MQPSAYDRFSSHDGISLAYRTAGRGRPVVLLHGASVNSTRNFATHFVDDGAGGTVPSTGPTVESALVESGCQVALLDLRGHGHSDKPHDAACYSMDAFADDVRAFMDHLEWTEAAVVGYSFGAWIAERLLGDPWLSRAALCGIGSSQVEGEDPEFDEIWTTASKCFLEGCWDDHPDFAPMRAQAEIAGADFVALGLVLGALRAMPAQILKEVEVQVLILNSGSDQGASDEWDLTPFIPGAQRAVAGDSHHRTAPSDPLFHAELVRFLAPKA